MTDHGELAPVSAPGHTTPSGDVAAALAEVEEQMMELAAHVRAALRDAATRVDPALQPFGFKILRTLRRCGPTHASALAESLDVDRSVISRQARLLEELGLLELAPDPADGRARFLAPTALAIEKMSAVPGSDKTFISARLAGWTEADLTQFARFLARLNVPDGPAAG
jgi:DNA-binding MarR family transcriptional regulator